MCVVGGGILGAEWQGPVETFFSAAIPEAQVLRGHELLNIFIDTAGAGYMVKIEIVVDCLRINFPFYQGMGTG